MSNASNTIISQEIQIGKLHQAALYYVRHYQFQVFPLSPCTKIPIANSNGYKDATTDIKQINQWWYENPNYNVGIATGQASGLFVVDVDIKPQLGKYGDESLNELIRQFGDLPETVQVISPSGGYHYYFRDREGYLFQKELARDVDLKGEGGYVVAPPSIDQDGTHYQFELSSHIKNVPIANPPHWLIEMGQQKQQSINLSDYEPKPAEDYLEILEGVKDGGRNNALMSLIGHLLGKRVDPRVAYKLIQAWNERNNPPLEEKTIKRAFDNIVKKELERWR